MTHHTFLAGSKEDPRLEFLQELKKVLGEEGSIIVYNEAFEKGVLKELAEAHPEFEEWVNNILLRVKDLLLPFRSFHYYHPTQHGSASIKKVLPALTGKSYDDLDINNGEIASLSFVKSAFEEIPDEEVRKIRDDLEKYCCLDTEGMIWIVEELEKLV